MDPRPGPATDGELVARIALGDEVAFAEVYARYAQHVFGAAVRLLGDRGTAEEVVQETWLALWNRAEQFDAARGSVAAWLLTIARNRSLDRYRATSRRPRLVSIGGDDNEGRDEAERMLAAGTPIGTGGEGGDPEAALDRSWTRAVVRSVLATLPDVERRVIELAYDDGLTQAEIATRVGWPIGTVKTRTRRALSRLREALAAPLGESLGEADGGR
jgi:RNA polymerase sigma-70 factor (ECF subfamily)